MSRMIFLTKIPGVKCELNPIVSKNNYSSQLDPPRDGLVLYS